jgi:hypothetical protein
LDETETPSNLIFEPTYTILDDFSYTLYDDGVLTLDLDNVRFLISFLFLYFSTFLV